MMNEDELLLARIHSAHHAKPRANVVAALSDEYPLTAEHERALPDFIERSMRPSTKHDRGRKKARPLDGSEKDYFDRALKEVRETANRLGCGQKLALEYLAGPRRSDYPNWAPATWAKVSAENLGLWRANAATLTEICGKEMRDRYDWSRFADQIAAKLHLN
jgi:hypothetical protein